jgi:TIR domain
MIGQIFISYCRDVASYQARLLYDRLASRFPQNQIFMDIDSIELGEDFVKTTEKIVGSCDVLIAVIGKGWQESLRRLAFSKDFMRIEIATALERGIGVIPVLLDGASVPQSVELPYELRALIRLNAVEVSHQRFNADSERLIASVEKMLEWAQTKRKRKPEE